MHAALSHRPCLSKGCMTQCPDERRMQSRRRYLAPNKSDSYFVDPLVGQRTIDVGYVELCASSCAPKLSAMTRKNEGVRRGRETVTIASKHVTSGETPSVSGWPRHPIISLAPDPRDTTRPIASIKGCVPALNCRQSSVTR